MLCGVDAWRSILCTWTESRVCSNLITVDRLKFLDTGRVVRRGNGYGKSGGEVVTILRCPRDVMVAYISSAPKISIKVYPAINLNLHTLVSSFPKLYDVQQILHFDTSLIISITYTLTHSIAHLTGTLSCTAITG